MTIIGRKIKYTKRKYQAYSLLNKVAHSFIKSSGGSVVSNANLSLQGTEMLEFFISKVLHDNSVTLSIRYSGTLLGTLRWKNGAWQGYRYLEQIQNLSSANMDGNLIPKLERSVSDLLNYKLYDNVTQFQVKVDEYQLAYTKYGRDGSIIDVAKSDRYLRGRGNYSI